MLPGPAFKTAKIFALATAAAALACAKVPHPPTAAIDAPATAHVGIRVQLDGTKSTPAAELPDPSSNPLSYQWKLAAVPTGSSVQLDDAAAPRPRFLPDAAGDYVVQLVVKDFAHESAPTLATVHASADCVPTVASAAATPAAVNVGQGTSLTGTALAPCNAAGTGPDPIVAYVWTIASSPAGSKARIVAPKQPNTTLVPDLRGTWVLSLQVTDALGFKSTAAQVTLTANACGDNLPSVDSVAASSASPNVGAAVRLSAQVSDGDVSSPCSIAHSLTYGWSIAAAPAGSKARLSSGNAETPSFTPDVAGDYVLALQVTDEQGRRSPRNTTVVRASACGGGVPMVTVVASSSSVTTGDVVQFVSSVNDPDVSSCGLPVTFAYAWQVVAAPLSSAASLNGTRLSNPTFRADAPGAYVFSVVVTASNGQRSNPVLVPVQVDVCGSAVPVATIVAPNGPATGVAFALGSLITDANSGCKTVQPYSYRWTLKSAPAGSLAQLSGVAASGTSAQAAPSVVPDIDGSYTVQLAVTDALGIASAPVTKTFTVAKCNAALTAPIAGPAGGVTGQPVTLSAGSILDANTVANGCLAATTGSFSYAWSIIGQPTGATAALNNPSDVSPSFTPAVAGPYSVQLVVTDAAGNQSPPATATVAVTSCNAPLTGTVPAVSGPTGQPMLLSASIADPNASGCNGLAVQPYSYAWAFFALPAGSVARLNNVSAASPSFVPDVPGSYVVSLVVTDAAGNSTGLLTGTATVAACTNAPSAPISSVLGAATSVPVALTTTPSDTNTVANGCPAATTASFTYAWSLIGRPAGSAAALNNPAAQSPAFTPDVPGTYAVSLVVTDAGGNASALQTQTVVVSNCTAPLTVAIPAVAGAKTATAATLAATVIDSNTVANGCPAATTATLSYAWTLLAVPAGSRAALDVPGSATPSFTPDLAGTYVGSVRVTDGAGNTGTATRTIAVSGCGASGGSAMTVATSVAPASPELGQRTILSAVVGDTNAPGCNALSTAPFNYAWFLRAPSGSRSVLSDQFAAQPTFVPDVAAGYEYGVTVTDALGYQVTAVSKSVLPLDCTLTPAISAVGAGQMTYSAVQLVGTATPANGACSSSFTYTWSFDSLPAASLARFTDARARTPSFIVDSPNGTWVARLTVTDMQTNAKTFTTRTVTSNSCGSSLPYATAGISLPFPISVSIPQPSPSVGSTVQYLPGYELQVDGTLSSDPAAACTGPLTFEWSTYTRPANSNAQLYPSTAGKPVFTPDRIGDYVFALSVSDGRFTSAPSYLHITVADPLTDQVSVTSRGVLWNDLEVPDPKNPSSSPAIAYYELDAAGTLYDLKYAQCTANCATASPTWNVSTIDAGAVDVGNGQRDTAQVSLKFLANGAPAVAYRYDPACQMRYAVFSGGAWQRSVIDNIPDTGGCLGIHGEIQLMFVGASKTVAVAYHSHLGGTLSANYAICAGAGCSTTGAGVSWSVQVVDTNTNPGHWMTAFVNPTTLNPSLAYHRDSNDLWYTACTARCNTTTATFSTPVRITNTGLWNSMSLGANGAVGIAFEDDATNRVRLATCPAASDCTATASWTLTTVATLAAGSYFPSLQFDAANRAHITYIDSASRTLRYAIQNSGTNTFQYFDIDHGVDDGHSSFILTPLGSTHVSYALTSGLKYYPFGD